jgi:hypothetical protein
LDLKDLVDQPAVASLDEDDEVHAFAGWAAGIADEVVRRDPDLTIGVDPAAAGRRAPGWDAGLLVGRAGAPDAVATVAGRVAGRGAAVEGAVRVVGAAVFVRAVPARPFVLGQRHLAGWHDQSRTGQRQHDCQQQQATGCA